MIEKLQVTVFWKEDINKFSDAETLGVYTYLCSILQNKGVSLPEEEASNLLCDRFGFSEAKANYLLENLKNVCLKVDDLQGALIWRLP